MSRRYEPIFRLLLVLAIGAGLSALAFRPAKPTIIGHIDRPKPIIMAIATDAQLPEHCLVPPHEDKDQALADQQSRDKSGGHVKKKIIACG